MTSGVRTRGRPPLPRQRIIDTALLIVDEDGPGALSLRTLAARLSSSTSTLYRHVSGRSELIELVVDQLVGDAHAAAGDLTPLKWTDALRRIVTSLFDVLSHHGRAAALLADTVPRGPNSMAVREQMLGILLGEGMPPLDALRAVATLGHYVVGFAMQSPVPDTPSQAGPTRPSPRDDLDPERFPHTVAVAPYLPRPLSEEFSYGLELMLHGLEDELKDIGAPVVRP